MKLHIFVDHRIHHRYTYCASFQFKCLKTEKIQHLTKKLVLWIEFLIVSLVSIKTVALYAHRIILFAVCYSLVVIAVLSIVCITKQSSKTQVV